MLSRRELIAGGAAAHMAGGNAAAAQRENDSDQLQSEMRTLRDVLVSMQSQSVVATPYVNTIRERQRNFYRLNQRFPQYIDVGIRVWERMQDWHVAHQRPLSIQAGGDGRYLMEFIMTILVLKHELRDEEIGQGYER